MREGGGEESRGGRLGAARMRSGGRSINCADVRGAWRVRCPIRHRASSRFSRLLLRERPAERSPSYRFPLRRRLLHPPLRSLLPSPHTPYAPARTPDSSPTPVLVNQHGFFVVVTNKTGERNGRRPHRAPPLRARPRALARPPPSPDTQPALAAPLRPRRRLLRPNRQRGQDAHGACRSLLTPLPHPGAHARSRASGRARRAANSSTQPLPAHTGGAQHWGAWRAAQRDHLRQLGRGRPRRLGGEWRLQELHAVSTLPSRRPAASRDVGGGAGQGRTLNEYRFGGCAHRSVGFASECLGQHAGDAQTANLGDGNGTST